MSTLGMDPGITKIGISVVSNDGELLHYELNSPQAEGRTVNERLINQMYLLYIDLNNFITEYRVERIVAELVPSFGKMGQQSRILAVQNLLRVIAMTREIPYAEIAPISVKKKFCGTTKATKDHVKAKVIETFPELEGEKMTYDVFDSIAIALLGKEFSENKFYEFKGEV